MESWIWILIPLTAIICVFAIPIITAHQRQMMELKLKMGQNVDRSLVAELQSMRQELAELRDTSTRYDMSFDAALQRIESRVGHLEGRVNSIEGTGASQVKQEAR